MYSFVAVLLVLSVAGWANAHLAAWANGMYCKNGASNNFNANSDDIVHPLYQLSKNDWWMHHYNGCDEYPPPDGEFLELPAGKSFTVEIGSNRGETSLSFSAKFASEWPDGGNYPEDYNVPSCITAPNMHTQNETQAAGTAFAISYQSDLSKVAIDNLSVFTVRYHTPWKRVTTYDVPADMPECPEGGCICTWLWVPNGCGQPNMYMTPFRCKVTGATSTKQIGTPKPPVWCEDDQSKCVSGPKQMIAWNQAEGNNIEVDGYDLAGEHKSPAYNSKLGFPDGAQNDIFTGSGSSSSSSSKSSSDSSSDSSSSSSTGSTKSTSKSSGASSSSSSSNSDSSGSSPASSSKAPTATSSVVPSASSTDTCKRSHHRRRQYDVAAKKRSSMVSGGHYERMMRKRAANVI